MASPWCPVPEIRWILPEGSRRDGFFETRAKGEDTHTNIPNSLTGENFGLDGPPNL
jgi:hypothetical protein